jgi:hypothetical protein
MANKKLIYGGIAVVVVAAMVLIKKKVTVAPTGSMIDNYLKKHPNSRDTKTGAGKVPMYVWLFSKKK